MYVKRIKVSQCEEKKLTVDREGEIVDIYEDAQVSWKLVCTKIESSSPTSRGGVNAST